MLKCKKIVPHHSPEHYSSKEKMLRGVIWHIFGDLNQSEKLSWDYATFKDQLNSKNKNGRTGFHLACYYGRHEVVSHLLKEADTKGIDINALTSKGSNAFYIACCQGKLEIVKLLVSEPKTQNQLNANKNQGTGFLKACYFGRYEIVSYLLEDADKKGIDITSTNHKG